MWNRVVIKVLLLFLLMFTQSWVYGKDTIKLVVASGGLSYRYAQELSPILGQMLNAHVVVELKAGGEGIVAVKQLINADADELVLLLGSAQNWNHLDLKDKPNQLTDLEIISYLGHVPGVVFTASSTIDTFDEIYRSSGLFYATSNTSPTRRYFENLFQNKDITRVPYTNGAQVLAAVLGKVVDFGVTPIDAVISQVGSKSIKPLAVLSKQRLSVLSSTPTMTELGYVTSNEQRYYNNIFLWSNKSYVNKSRLEKLKISVKKYITSREFESLKVKMNIHVDQENVQSSLKYLDFLINY